MAVLLLALTWHKASAVLSASSSPGLCGAWGLPALGAESAAEDTALLRLSMERVGELGHAQWHGDGRARLAQPSWGSQQPEKLDQAPHRGPWGGSAAVTQHVPQHVPS